MDPSNPTLIIVERGKPLSREITVGLIRALMLHIMVITRLHASYARFGSPQETTLVIVTSPEDRISVHDVIREMREQAHQSIALVLKPAEPVVPMSQVFADLRKNSSPPPFYKRRSRRKGPPY